ncbi:MULTISPECIES: hypothetical protein [Aphanothece]|uniref:hypothetical protein n=1 Tax=Aphanothece TaxID=1121 RepID=UPI00398ECF03
MLFLRQQDLLSGSRWKEQEQIAALQELLRWKQWALSDHGWDFLKQRIEEDCRRTREGVDEVPCTPQPAADVKRVMETFRTSQEKSVKVPLVAVLSLLLVATTFAALGPDCESRGLLREHALAADYGWFR